jgi:3-oxoacyl-[acyl-carrier protein] reductase
VLREKEKMEEMKGSVALITGGSRGIGRGISLSLAKEGMNVAFFYRIREEEANETIKELSTYGIKCKGYRVDVTNYEQIEKAANDVYKDFGRLDVLVNNAGRSPSISFLVDVPLKEWQGVLDLDLTGVFYCCRAVVPIMRRQKGGNIVNISSVVGSNCKEASACYAAAKAGVNALTRVLAKEEGRNGIRVNCVSPGFIETRMSLKMIEAMGEDVFNKILAERPLPGMRGLPEDIGNTVVFLISENSRFMTGQVIHVDGGAWMA